jgi:hypothetical protein
MMKALRHWLLALPLVVASAPALAVVTLVGTSALGGGNGTSFTVSRPAGIAAGDVLLAVVSVKQGGSANVITAPAGWSSVVLTDAGSSEFRQQVFWKAVAAGDPASDTFTTSSSGRASAIMLAYRGVDSLNPIAAQGGQANASSGSVTAPSISPAVADTMLVGLFGSSRANAGISAPPGMTLEAADNSAGGPNGVASAAADELLVAAGATGTRVAPVLTSAVSIGQLVALRPARSFLVEAQGGGNIGSQVAGFSFNIRVTALTPGGATDASFNGTVDVSSTGTLSAGSGTTASFVNGVLASWSVRISDVGSFTITATETGLASFGISNSFLVLPKLQLLVPGESAAPATLAGKTGTPATQVAGTPFNVIVNGVDEYWNVVPTANDTISLTSSDGAAVLPAGAALVNGTLTFSLTLNTPPSQTLSANSTLLRIDTSPAIPLSAPGGSFNACDAGAAVCDNATPSTYIKTKVAGAAFSLDIVALKSDGTLDTNYNATVQIELLDASDNSGALDSDGCRATWIGIATLSPDPSFSPADNGRITVGPFAVAEAYRDVRVRVTNVTGASRRGCSTDDFAIRPASFSALSVSDTDWITAGTGRALSDVTLGSVTHKAGQPFSVRAQAVNAAATPAVTANYAGAPSVSLSACAGAACSASFGTLTLGASFGAGQLVSDAATYSEVGAFRLQLVDDAFAAVDNGDGSTLAERRIASAPLDAGRFVPDHLAIAAGSTLGNRAAAACAPASSFTYLGEGFSVAFTLQAENASGALTQLYQGALARLDPATPAALGFGALSGAADLSARIDSALGSAGSFSAGAAAVSATLALTRASPDSPDGPYANAKLGAAPQDADGVGLASAALDMDVDGVGGNDHLQLGANTEFRFGRLRMQNALGPANAALPVPITAQYWNGGAFATNTLDSCSRIPQSAIVLDGYQGALAPGGGNCKSYVQQNPVAFSAGVGTLTLAAPTGGASGSVRLTPNLATAASGNYCQNAASGETPASAAVLPYLLGRWNDTLDPDASASTMYDDNPSARAAFGLYGSQPDNLIFQRENY